MCERQKERESEILDYRILKDIPSRTEPILWKLKIFIHLLFFLPKRSI